jgi:hypothetical protein
MEANDERWPAPQESLVLGACGSEGEKGTQRRGDVIIINRERRGRERGRGRER